MCSVELSAPEFGGPPSRTCPKCRGEASVHARRRRAIHDWAVTFVECLRLRCCGGTFMATPAGLTVRARYSDRVVAVGRAMVAIGTSLRRAAQLFRAAGVSVTAQTVGEWCADVRPEMCATMRATASPAGSVRLRLRPGLWLSVETRTPRKAVRILERELLERFHAKR